MTRSLFRIPHAAPPRSLRGFTLVELAAVFTILATLGVMLVPRFAHNDATLPAQADQIGRVLRHAQALAMAQGRALTFDVLSGSSYAITDGVSPVRDPAGELQSYALRNGAVFTSGADVRFDSLGRPMNGASLLSASQSWVLGPGVTVSIEPVTGFVTVTP